MQDALSNVLIGRSRHADGLNKMIGASIIVHAVFLTAVVLMPSDWLRMAPRQESTPMTISLGPAGQQDTGGMTAIAARAVQAESPDSKPMTTPPAAKTPEMVAPAPEAKPKPVTKPVEKPLDKSATKRPSTGAEVRSGAARVETPNAAQVPFGGLAEQSGGKSTGGVRLDVGNFCCPEYIETMVQRIRANWDQQQGVAGETEVKFTIRRDGMLTNIEVSKGSGNPLLDLQARLAVHTTKQLPPLPAQFTPASLTVYVIFDYKR